LEKNVTINPTGSTTQLVDFQVTESSVLVFVTDYRSHKLFSLDQQTKRFKDLLALSTDSYCFLSNAGPSKQSKMHYLFCEHVYTNNRSRFAYSSIDGITWSENPSLGLSYTVSYARGAYRSGGIGSYKVSQDGISFTSETPVYSTKTPLDMGPVCLESGCVYVSTQDNSVFYSSSL